MGAEDARRAALALCALVLALTPLVTAAPVTESEIELYNGTGCYYNFNHYGEGDRIVTNEPCLNCTCHNRMLMCYLRVCPFTKIIGRDCNVVHRSGDCCPVIECPDVRVDTMALSVASPEDTKDVGLHRKYGCTIDDKYYPEGSMVPSNMDTPCELCYCIRNSTACQMTECTLHFDGCTPIYQKGVCCPIRYSCDHPEEEAPLELDDGITTTVRPTPGFILTTTTAPGYTQECIFDGVTYADGANIDTDKPCEHCYCMKGDVVCAVQECQSELEDDEGKNCTALPPQKGQCCPQKYVCEGDEIEATTVGGEEIAVTTLRPELEDRVPILDGQEEEKPSVEEQSTTVSADEKEVTHAEKDVTHPATVPDEHVDIAHIVPDEGEKTTPASDDLKYVDDDHKETTIADVHKETTKPEPSVGEPTTHAPEDHKPIEDEEPEEVEATTPSRDDEEKLITTYAEPAVDEHITTVAADQKETTHPKVDESITTVSADEKGTTTRPEPSVDEHATSAPEDQKPIEHEEPEEIEATTQSRDEERLTTHAEPAIDEHKTTIFDDDHKETTRPDLKTTVYDDKKEPSVDEHATTVSDRDEIEHHAPEEIGHTTFSPEDAKYATEPATDEQATTLFEGEVPGEAEKTTPSSHDLEHSEPAAVDEHVTTDEHATTISDVHKETTRPEIDEKITTVSADEKGTTHPEPSEEEHSTVAPDDQKAITHYVPEKGEETTPSSDDVKQTEHSEPSIDEHTTAIYDDQKETTRPGSKIDEGKIDEQITTVSDDRKDATHAEPTTVFDDGQEEITHPASEGEKTTTIRPTTEKSTRHEDNYTTKDVVQHTAITSSPEDIVTDGEAPDSGVTGVEHDGQVKEQTTHYPIEKIPEEVTEGITDEPEKSAEVTEKAVEPTIYEDRTEVPEHATKLFEESTTTKVEEHTAAPAIKYEPTEAIDENTVIPEIVPTTERDADHEQESSGDFGIGTSKPEDEKHTPVEEHRKDTTLEVEAGAFTTPSAVTERAEKTTIPGEDQISTKHPEYTHEEVTPEEKLATTIASEEEPTTIYEKTTLRSEITTEKADGEITQSTPAVEQYAEEPSRIPGEGDCLVDGVTYRHNTLVPPMTKCQTTCSCFNSILKCERVECPPPPPNMKNCQPAQHNKDACCPTYMCEHPITVSPIQSGSQISDGHPATEQSETDIPSATETDKAEQATESHVTEGVPTTERVPTLASEYLPDCGPGGCFKDTTKAGQEISTTTDDINQFSAVTTVPFTERASTEREITIRPVVDETATEIPESEVKTTYSPIIDVSDDDANKIFDDITTLPPVEYATDKKDIDSRLPEDLESTTLFDDSKTPEVVKSTEGIESTSPHADTERTESVPITTGYKTPGEEEEIVTAKVEEYTTPADSHSTVHPEKDETESPKESETSAYEPTDRTTVEKQTTVAAEVQTEKSVVEVTTVSIVSANEVGVSVQPTDSVETDCGESDCAAQVPEEVPTAPSQCADSECEGAIDQKSPATEKPAQPEQECADGKCEGAIDQKSPATEKPAQPDQVQCTSGDCAPSAPACVGDKCVADEKENAIESECHDGDCEPKPVSGQKPDDCGEGGCDVPTTVKYETTPIPKIPEETTEERIEDNEVESGPPCGPGGCDEDQKHATKQPESPIECDDEECVRVTSKPLESGIKADCQGKPCEAGVEPSDDDQSRTTSIPDESAVTEKAQEPIDCHGEECKPIVPTECAGEKCEVVPPTEVVETPIEKTSVKPLCSSEQGCEITPSEEKKADTTTPASVEKESTTIKSDETDIPKESTEQEPTEKSVHTTISETATEYIEKATTEKYDTEHVTEGHTEKVSQDATEVPHAQTEGVRPDDITEAEEGEKTTIHDYTPEIERSTEFSTKGLPLEVTSAPEHTDKYETEAAHTDHELPATTPKSDIVSEPEATPADEIVTAPDAEATTKRSEEVEPTQKEPEVTVQPDTIDKDHTESAEKPADKLPETTERVTVVPAVEPEQATTLKTVEETEQPLHEITTLRSDVDATEKAVTLDDRVKPEEPSEAEVSTKSYETSGPEATEKPSEPELSTEAHETRRPEKPEEPEITRVTPSEVEQDTGATQAETEAATESALGVKTDKPEHAEEQTTEAHSTKDVPESTDKYETESPALHEVPEKTEKPEKADVTPGVDATEKPDLLKVTVIPEEKITESPDAKLETTGLPEEPEKVHIEDHTESQEATTAYVAPVTSKIVTESPVHEPEIDHSDDGDTEPIGVTDDEISTDAQTKKPTDFVESHTKPSEPETTVYEKATEAESPETVTDHVIILGPHDESKPPSIDSDDHLKSTEVTEPEEEAITKLYTTTESAKADEITDRLSESSTAKPVDEVTDRLSESSTGKPVDEVTDRLSESSTEKPVDEVTDRLSESSTGKPVDEVTDRVSESSTAKPVDEVTDRLPESSTGKPVDEVADRLSESSTGKPVDEITEKISESSTERPVEEITDKLSETSTERSPDAVEHTTSYDADDVHTTERLASETDVPSISDHVTEKHLPTDSESTEKSPEEIDITTTPKDERIAEEVTRAEEKEPVTESAKTTQAEITTKFSEASEEVITTISDDAGKTSPAKDSTAAAEVTTEHIRTETDRIEVPTEKPEEVKIEEGVSTVMDIEKTTTIPESDDHVKSSVETEIPDKVAEVTEGLSTDYDRATTPSSVEKSTERIVPGFTDVSESATDASHDEKEVTSEIAEPTKRPEESESTEVPHAQTEGVRPDDITEAEEGEKTTIHDYTPEIERSTEYSTKGVPQEVTIAPEHTDKYETEAAHTDHELPATTPKSDIVSEPESTTPADEIVTVPEAEATTKRSGEVEPTEKEPEVTVQPEIADKEHTEPSEEPAKTTERVTVVPAVEPEQATTLKTADETEQPLHEITTLRSDVDATEKAVTLDDRVKPEEPEEHQTEAATESAKPEEPEITARPTPAVYEPDTPDQDQEELTPQQQHVDTDAEPPQFTDKPHTSTESPFTFGSHEPSEQPDYETTEEDSPQSPYGGQQPEDYDESETPFGPGTCRYAGKVYVSAQQIPRDDPCDFCFCFRSDIICLQQSCPPPIQHCHEEPIQGFCCPRYECPVSMATVVNATTTTTTTTTTLPPHFLAHAYKGAARKQGCQIQGKAYRVGEVVRSASGPCLHCTCGGDGQMKCDPKVCTPEPMLRQMIAAVATSRRRR